MAPNALLLRQVLAQIEEHPETWEQMDWRAARRCGTAMCFAGWTAELSGGQWLGESGPYLQPEPNDLDDGIQPTPYDLPGVHVCDRATRHLGITHAQAERLFDGGNDLDDIRCQVAELIAEVRHVTIRLVPADEVVLDEAMPDGRPPMEIVEHRPGLALYTHGTERGFPPHELRQRARAVADRLGVAYVDPGADVLGLLVSAEAV